MTRVGKAFVGCPLGLRPTATDGFWEVRFGWQVIDRLDLRTEGKLIRRGAHP